MPSRKATFTLPVTMRIDFKNAGLRADPRHKRIYVSVNAMAFILNQIRRRFSDLETALIAYDEAERDRDRSSSPEPEDGRCFCDMGYPKRNDIVSAAWDVVDWIDRFRKVLGAIAGIKKREPWFQVATRALAGTEQIRHFLQHYDQALQTLVEGTYPLMGAVIASFATSGGYYSAEAGLQLRLARLDLPRDHLHPTARALALSGIQVRIGAWVSSASGLLAAADVFRER